MLRQLYNLQQDIYVPNAVQMSSTIRQPKPTLIHYLSQNSDWPCQCNGYTPDLQTKVTSNLCHITCHLC